MVSRFVPAAVLALLAFGASLPIQAQTLDRIRESGSFKIGYREDAAPFAFKNAVGEPAGFSVELCRLIAAEAKDALDLSEISIEYVAVGTEDRFQAIQDGRIDILCGATTATISRRELVDFSLFTFLDGAGVMLPIDGAEDFEALAGKKIGVRGATTTEEALRNTLEDLSMDAEVVPVAGHDEGIDKLTGGDIAAYFADRAILVFLATNSDMIEQIKISETQFTYEPYALALTRGDDDFRLLVDRTLARVYRSRILDQLFTNSFGPDAGKSELLQAVYLLNGLPD